MAAITWEFPPVTDASGALVSGATVTVASVTTKSGVAVASHGATVNGVDGANVLTGSNVSVEYDPQGKGDAYVELLVSKAATAFGGTLSSPRRYLTRDAQLILGALVAAGSDPGGVNVAAWKGGAIDALEETVLALAVGVVSASPTPTASTFTVTGATLVAPSGGYSIAPMFVLFQSGVNKTIKVPLVKGASGHVRSGSDHTLTVASPFPNAPAAGDVLVVA